MVLDACILTMLAISIAQEDLQRIIPPQGQVALTIFVHEGNLSGPSFQASRLLARTHQGLALTG
jgi:hypothetical protein